MAALERMGVSGVVPNLVIDDATSLSPLTVIGTFTASGCSRVSVTESVRRRRSRHLRYHDGIRRTMYTSITAEWRMENG